MSEQANPRPWKLIDHVENRLYRDADEYDYEHVMQHCWYIAGPLDYSDFVADLVTSRDAVGDANAELIVRAVNSHDDLVAALKSAKSELGFLHVGSDRTILVIDKIDAALAKAEVK